MILRRDEGGGGRTARDHLLDVAGQPRDVLPVREFVVTVRVGRETRPARDLLHDEPHERPVPRVRKPSGKGQDHIGMPAESARKLRREPPRSLLLGGVVRSGCQAD